MFQKCGYTVVLRKRGRRNCIWSCSDGTAGNGGQAKNRRLSAVVWNRKTPEIDRHIIWSGGEKRKVSLACILSLNPEVLILDEPLAGLDEKTQDMLLEFLQSFHKAGKTLITITHNRQLAETIGNRFAVMNEREHELKNDIKKVLPAELEVLFLLWS
ncbi:MAG: ATP-binding cassette domain-containing protein [Lachnospiraceae bacterium]